ncbi:MAG TPA: hypothetical protein VEL70_06185 [Candidatus Acidoferrum sp.]|nr:hypothetical protein [Candidatus Acidoferrum sp.]
MIYLHLDHNDAKKIHDDKLKGNLIVLGHLAGDSIGLNALANRLEGLGWRVSHLPKVAPSWMMTVRPGLARRFL